MLQLISFFRRILITETELWDKIVFHGLKPSPRHFPAVIMLPAIIKIKTSSTSDDGCYWWDYTASGGPEFKPKSVLRRPSYGNGNGNYQVLGSEVDECGLDDEYDEQHHNPKRSESTTCFRNTTSTGNYGKKIIYV